MAIQTATMRTHLADRYGDEALYGALYTTAPGASAGTEVTGGSPAYARKALTWSTASASASSVTVVFDVPAGTTVVGAGVHTAVTAGTYLDGVAVTSQAFATQGTYSVTFTITIS
jgi:phage gp46-like protein